jgi:hypothetical protein
MPKRKKGKYEVLDEEEFYRRGRSRGVIKISEEKNSKIRTIAFSREFQKNDGSWVPRKKKFFAISFELIGKFIEILIKFARKFSWPVRSVEKSEEKIKKLEKQLDDAIRQKTDLEEAIKTLGNQIESYKKELEIYRQQIIRSNIEVFKRDVEEFENLLKRYESQQINEETIQEFLTKKRWIFGPEYHNVEPKKPAGSKSKFDFYLEDYKGKGTIVELKLPSDSIFSKNEEYGLSPKCAESLGQLIRYIETTIAIAHSKEMSRIEKITETKPLGFLIIGRTKDEREIKRLETLNFYFHRSIEILSYDMLLKRAKVFLSPFIGEIK